MTTPPERLVVDTDVVIHLLQKKPETVERFLSLWEQSVVYLLSPIVVAEVYAGAFRREYQQIEGFFELCERLSLDVETARLAVNMPTGTARRIRGFR